MGNNWFKKLQKNGLKQFGLPPSPLSDMFVNYEKYKHLENSDKIGWDLIWEKKGATLENDVTLLNGYEDTEFNSVKCFTNIIEKLNIKKDDKILEIGSGAGLISQHFKDYNYLVCNM